MSDMNHPLDKPDTDVAGSGGRKDSEAFLTKRHIPHEEAREIAQRLINSHFHKEPHARVGIPARPDYDDDLLIIAYIRQQQAAAQLLDFVSYELMSDTLTIDGYKFSRDFFTYVTASPCGITFRIIERNDGVITITQDRDPMAVAAPDMLAALRGARVIIETCGWPDDVSDGVRAAFDRRRAAIVAAIAKATLTEQVKQPDANPS